jgi:quercetin dioxygenase-like cupin family protein
LKTCVLPLLFAALASPLVCQQTPVPVDQEPLHHVVLKNDRIMVIHVTLPPGDTTLYHTHSHDRFAIGLSDSTIAQQEWNQPEGKPSPSTPGRVTTLQEDKPYTHRVHNVGSTPFDVLDVEILARPLNSTTNSSANKAAASNPAGPVAAENASARVYKYVLAPGASSAMHTHEHPYLIVAATAMQLKMTAPDGKSLDHEINPGEFHWVDTLITHTLTNTGQSEGNS